MATRSTQILSEDVLLYFNYNPWISKGAKVYLNHLRSLKAVEVNLTISVIQKKNLIIHLELEGKIEEVMVN